MSDYNKKLTESWIVECDRLKGQLFFALAANERGESFEQNCDACDGTGQTDR